MRRFSLFPEPWTRARIASLCAVGVGLSHAAGTHVRGPKLADIEAALGLEASVQVAPNTLRWLPSEGSLSDMWWGRRAVFVASPKGAAADLFVARVRVAPWGQTLFVSAAHNLTSTPLGSDGQLVVQGTRVAFRTYAYGQVQSVSMLDFAGEGELSQCRGAFSRALCNINNLQATGLWKGVARYEAQLQTPAREVGLQLSPEALQLQARGDQGTSVLEIPWKRAPDSTSSVALEGVKHMPKTFVIWAVDTVRAVSWIGPEPIAWAEEKAFALKDFVRRTLYSTGGATQELAASSHTASVAVAGEATATVWPPARTSSLWKTPEAGEGVWVEPRVPWVRKLDPAAPPAFYQTFVRPDTERPYSKVLLVAMDTRQLELAMEAGSEDPEPDVGPTGTGHIPRDPAIARRVSAVWNGGFKSEHGHYGMAVNRRVLLPPVPGGASVVTLSDGRMAMGTWGANKTMGGLQNVPDGALVSMRQNLDPLLEDGELNPKGRKLWGYTRADNEGMQTHRSGMCVTASGTLIYAWGDDVNASALGRAMKLAGCSYGMHLDMNPGHTAFMFTNIVDVRSKNYKSVLLEPDMIKSTERYIEWAQKDFFYVLTRSTDAPGPAPFAAVPELSAEPSWLPPLKRAKLGEVDLYALDAGRVRGELELGLGEHVAESQRAHLLSTVPAQAMFRCTMGNTASSAPLGMALGTSVLVLPSRADANTGTLYGSSDGLALVPTAQLEGAKPTTFRAELPWLLHDGAPVEGAELVAAALGRAPNGAWLLATHEGGISARAAAEALRAYGVADAVSLSRGKRKHPHCGVESAASTRSEETSLRFVAQAARPMAFPFKALVPAPVAK